MSVLVWCFAVEEGDGGDDLFDFCDFRVQEQSEKALRACCLHLVFKQKVPTVFIAALLSAHPDGEGQAA
jgi:hypothetical protein